MKVPIQFTKQAKQLLKLSALIDYTEDLGSNENFRYLISVEEEIVANFGLPADATEVSEMLQAFELYGDESKKVIHDFYEQLTNFATWKLSTNAKTDLQLLKEAQKNNLLFHQVMPYMGYNCTILNEFVYKHCLLYLQLPAKKVVAIFIQIKNDESELCKANIAINDYTSWMQWQTLLQRSGFEYYLEFGKYCEYKLFIIEHVKQLLLNDNNLYHVRKIYFDEDALDTSMLQVDIDCCQNKKLYSAKLSIHKKHIFKAILEPMNMNFHEVLQGVLTTFFEDDEEDFEYPDSIDLVGNYNRGIVINKNILK
jgi:hypothetical protein